MPPLDMPSGFDLEKTILVWNDVDDIPKDILKAVGGFIDDLNYVAFVPKGLDYPSAWEHIPYEMKAFPYKNGVIYVSQH